MKMLRTIIALFAPLLSPLTALHAAEGGASKPNIVIFIADDLTWHDVACFGGPTDARTPHLDRLASEGLKLTGFFSPASVCSPTRQSLLTGMYPVRTGAYPNHSHVEPGTRSLPHHLKALGYRTACVGKTHFGPPASYPFDKMLPMTGEKAGGKGEGAGDGEIDTAAMAQFIKADAAQPFCLYIATHEPHGPWTKGDPSAYDPAKLKLPPCLVDTPETRRGLAAYYAEVTCTDSQVGDVLQLIERTGHTADTLFLFVSEQGSSVPQGKWTLYDPGIRVAAIARWPGKIKPGTANAALVQYVDVLPTLIAAAGGDPAKIDTGCPDAMGGHGFDGRSFLEVLTGRTEHHRDYVFAQHTARGIINGPEAYGTRCVRDTRWKLIVNLEPDTEFRNAISNGALLKSWRKKGEAGDAFARAQAARYTKRPAVELYDLQTDPWELTNIAANPANADTLTRLRSQLDAWMKQQGDEGDKTEREANQHQGAGGAKRTGQKKANPKKPKNPTPVK
ncbi:MAG: sulfatase [Akkermansiaceae bacterium]|nr:sulfatase [Akkermansiaceae bacterium]MCF7733635.1 sulfatase [Akkermansiaceae bacterium]